MTPRRIRSNVLAERLAEEQAARQALRALVPPDEGDRWAALAEKHGDDRTRRAAAMGLTPETWAQLALYPDHVLDWLRRYHE